MKILFCGSRNWTNEKVIEDHIKILPKDTVIIEGKCRGADVISGKLARKYGLEVHEYPAKWSKYGKAAGPIRNQEMLDKEHPDRVLAFHDYFCLSKGTFDVVRRAIKANIPVVVISSNGENLGYPFNRKI